MAVDVPRDRRDGSNRGAHERRRAGVHVRGGLITSTSSCVTAWSRPAGTAGNGGSILV